MVRAGHWHLLLAVRAGQYVIYVNCYELRCSCVWCVHFRIAISFWIFLLVCNVLLWLVLKSFRWLYLLTVSFSILLLWGPWCCVSWMQQKDESFFFFCVYSVCLSRSWGHRCGGISVSSLCRVLLFCGGGGGGGDMYECFPPWFASLGWFIPCALLGVISLFRLDFLSNAFYRARFVTIWFFIM